jgi:hypothetical protein
VVTLWTSDRPVKLSFENLGFTSAEVARLNQLGTVTSLEIHNCTFKAPIRLPSTLQSLVVARILIHDLQAEPLPHLKSLCIVSGPMESEDWARLINWDLPSLREVWLGGASLRMDQVGFMTTFLRSKPSLRKLRLGGMEEVLVEPLFSNLHLRHLRTLKMDTVCENLELIAKGFTRHPHLRDLDLNSMGESKIDFNPLIQSFEVFDTVKRLRLSSIGTAQFHTYLATTSSLKILTLNRFHCSTQDDWDSLMSGIELNQTIRNLDVSYLHTTPSIKIIPGLVRMLAGNQTLRILQMREAQIGAGLMALTEGLASNSGLRRIDLGSNNFDASGLDHLYRIIGSHPSIRVWELCEPLAIGSTLAELGAAIARNPHILGVRIGAVEAPEGQMDAFLMQLGGHPGLTQLSVGGNPPIVGLTHLIRTTTRIQKLRIGLGAFTYAQVRAIYQAMCMNPSITYFGIGWSEFDFRDLFRRNQHNRSQRGRTLYSLLIPQAFDPRVDELC